MQWNIPNVVITGNAHSKLKVKGQDFVKVKVSHDFAVIVMTDGVGTSSCAFEGSRGIAEVVAESISKRKSDILYWENVEFSNFVENIIKDFLFIKSDELGCNPKDLNSTIMIFISDGEKYLAASMGDGLIGRVSEDEGKVILAPEHGRYLNESYFVATSDFKSHFRIARGMFNSEWVYVMMTDGSCECLFNPRDEAFSNALYIMCEWSKKYSKEAVNNAIFDTMQKLFRRTTNDDCALALITQAKGWHG